VVHPSKQGLSGQQGLPPAQLLPEGGLVSGVYCEVATTMGRSPDVQPVERHLGRWMAEMGAGGLSLQLRLILLIGNLGKPGAA
jgi:hypothetical protein